MRIVVDVMPKPVILDPQGKAIRRALPGEIFADVRQGKRFELTIADGVEPDAALTAAREAAEHLLSNPIIEDVVSIRIEEQPCESE